MINTNRLRSKSILSQIVINIVNISRGITNLKFIIVMENFISKNQEAWRTNFRVNAKMKSRNKKLLALYDIILKNEKADSDYWYFIGADEFISYFSYLDTKDFQELIADIPNWTEDQKWI